MAKVRPYLFYDTATSTNAFGYASMGLNANVPLACLPKRFGTWSVTNGFNVMFLGDALEGILATMQRMPEHCDPYVYYHRVRPYIFGWHNNPALPGGLVYEGVAAYAGTGQTFRGETGAQSTIVPCLDAILGVEHAFGNRTACPTCCACNDDAKCHGFIRYRSSRPVRAEVLCRN